MSDDVELERAGQALAQAGAPAPTTTSCPSWRRSCHKPTCGNGVVETNEACDDGNQTSGDGCSASCQLDDDTRTPGDDRATYVSCTSASSGTQLTCGEGLGCCPDPTNNPAPICAATRTECGFVMAYIVYCDGPEDCTNGNPCMATRTGQECSTSGYYAMCHKDADCPSGQACDAHGNCHAP